MFMLTTYITCFAIYLGTQQCINFYFRGNISSFMTENNSSRFFWSPGIYIYTDFSINVRVCSVLCSLFSVLYVIEKSVIYTITTLHIQINNIGSVSTAIVCLYICSCLPNPDGLPQVYQCRRYGGPPSPSSPTFDDGASPGDVDTDSSPRPDRWHRHAAGRSPPHARRR